MNDESREGRGTMIEQEAVPLPVMEYGREGELETRAGRVRWLLGGMLILSLVSACTMLAESVAVVVVSWLSIASELEALLGAGVGLTVFVLLLVGLLFYASNPARGPALLSPDRPAALSAVLICALIVVVMAAAFVARIATYRFIGVGSLGSIYRIQAYFSYLRGLVFPIALVVAMVVLRRRR